MDILRKQFLEHIGQTSPSPLMIKVARAEGVFFYSPDGKRYYDLISGVSVSNVGHGNSAVVSAVQQQAADYMHVMVYGETIEAPQVRYAMRLCEQLPEHFDSVYFINSGSEAVETGLKLAKRYTGRREMISCHNSYHGSTQGSLSVMGSETYKNSFRPLLPDVRHIRYNNFDDIEHISDRTACVLIEPVQGEAGVRLPEEGYLKAIRERCTEVGTMLIFDEIQTGFGRTGALFAMLKYGVAPDILLLAKALGGGMPLGAVVSSKKVLDSFTTNPVLGHITTFGGHSVCCAAGLAAFEYIVDNRLAERAQAMGARYEHILSSHPKVIEVRRTGLLMAVELGSSELMFKVMERMIAGGILSDWFLFCDTAFRISPPLTISPQEVDDSCQIIIEALDFC